MKTSKSPKNAEVTPSKKKLKQARLPFKPKSDDEPAPVAPQTRKRKLSASGDESATKIGKVCKENYVSEDSVIISDDDSKPIETEKKDEKTLNPFVKLVDTAWKKKQKAKKKHGKKTSKVPNSSVESEKESATDSVDDKEPDCEIMDVDEPGTEVSDDKDSKEIQQETDKSINVNNVSEIVVLEDSNNSTDVQTKETVVNTDICENKNKKSVDVNEITKSLDKSNKVQTDNDTDECPKEINNDKQEDMSEVKSPANTPVTPKRSARNIAKAEQNNNMNSPSNKLNGSVTSNPTTPKTPKHSRSSSVTNSQGDVSLNESTTSADLTPKQLQKKLESAKKKEEKEKERQEREKKKQQEKEDKAKLRQEKEDQRKKEKEEKEEAKKKEKEEKEEQKRKEKEEKDKLKEIERKQREEKEEQKKKEREEKEEQKRKEKEAKEEEKRKKQEALELEKQEAELKKKKAAEVFSKFLVPKQKFDKDQATINSVSKNSVLSNFTIKVDMRLAPLIRANLDSDKKQEFDNSLQKQDVAQSSLYLKRLKDGSSKPLCSGKTWPLSDKDDDDVMIIEDELPPIVGAGVTLNSEPARERLLRPKLISFHDNRRPPYWGTWRKRSPFVKARRPFGRDKKHVDYSVDSDEEWEEEQEGESLDGSAAGSDDDQDADEYELDNVVFVPHGYLSDEEATMDEDDVLSLSPDTQKARLKHLEDEFESEMKKPTEKLKPRMYGLLWETSDGGKPEKCTDALWSYFGKLSMMMDDPTSLLQPSNEPQETEKKKPNKKKKVVDGEQKNSKVDKTKKAEDKEGKTPKAETKKSISEAMKNQPDDKLRPIVSASLYLKYEQFRKRLRPKLLSFHDNKRPPYWGTWWKRSAYVKARRPFGRDKKYLNYEVDSDEEWQEEKEGETIHGSMAVSDDDVRDADEYEKGKMDKDDVLSHSPDTQKVSLKHLDDEFKSERKKLTEKLKPRMYRLLWETSDGGKPEKCVDALWSHCRKLSMLMNDPTPLLQPSSESHETEKKKLKKRKFVDGEQKSSKVDKKKKADDTDGKSSKAENKTYVLGTMENQSGINKCLTKLQSS